MKRATVYFNSDSEPLLIIDDKIADVESNNSWRYNINKWLAYFDIDEYDEEELSDDDWDDMYESFERHYLIKGLV